MKEAGDTGEKLELRVLQVFTCLSVGGAETWLMALLRYFDSSRAGLPYRLRLDICLTGGRPDVFDEEAKALGARLFYIPYSRKRIPAFRREFRRLLEVGRYHAIHDHQDYAAGIHFFLGSDKLPPVRIAHVHNPKFEVLERNATYQRRMIERLGKRFVARYATHVMGTSEEVLASYGFDRQSLGNVELGAAYCGFEVRDFEADPVKLHADLCREFGWHDGAKILLFVGRLGSDELHELGLIKNQKNPTFALHVARECVRIDPDVRLLMVGAGERRRRELSEKVSSWGLDSHLRLIGPRSDVPRLMGGADLLLFPSIAEGLGMVAVEAQAAGLRVLASDATPRECSVIPEMVCFKPLADGASSWANETVRLLNLGRPNSKDSNLAVRKSAFSIENSAKRLIGLYEGGVAASGLLETRAHVATLRRT